MEIKKHITVDLKRNLNQAQRVYRQPIFIEKKSDPIQNPDGTWSIDGWSLRKKVYANVAKFSSREGFEAGQTHNEENLRFFIRYMSGIDNEVKEEYRIRFRDKIYNIDSVTSINYRDEELEITCNQRSITDASD